MLNRFASPLILILPLALLAAACGDDAEEVVNGGNDNGTDNGSADDNGDGNGSDADVTVSAIDFSFSPATIDAAPGEEISVTVTNDGNAPHTFTIDALEVDAVLDPGEEATVSLTPEGGERFYCRFHEAAGMEGALSGGGGAAADSDPTEAPGNEFNY